MKIIPWIRIGRSGRFKYISKGELIKFLFPPLITVAVVLTGLFLYTPWILYKNEKGTKDWFPNPLHLIRQRFPEMLSQNLRAMINVIRAREPFKESLLPSVNLLVPDNALEMLDHKNLLYNLGNYLKRPRIKGNYQLSEDGRMYPVSLNIRGIGAHHHLVWKPSLKIKFEKGQLMEGHRDHILIAPEDGIGLRNWISSKLSEQWGLLSNGEHLVRLNINNKFMGLYNRVWRLDESLLIQSKLLPGPFFRLELINKRDFFRARMFWYEPRGWKTIGIPSSEGHAIINQITGLAQLLVRWTPSQSRGSLIENIETLNEMLDRDKFAKYLSLLSHAFGEHVDDFHNNAFWLDEVSGKLVPILMDVNGYGMFVEEVLPDHEVIKHNGAFVLAWLRDPRNLGLYVERLYELIHTIGSYERMEKMLRNQWEKIEPELNSDMFFSRIGNPREILAVTDSEDNFQSLLRFIKFRNELIENKIQADRISISRRAKGGFEVLVQGLAGVEVKRRDGKTFEVFGFDPFLSKYENKFNKPVKGARLNLLPSMAFETKEDKKPLFYAFYWLSGNPEEYSFVHRLNREPITFTEPAGNLDHMRAHAGVNPFTFPVSDARPVYLGPGKEVIRETRIYNLKQPVFIRPGTRLLLAPGVSLVIKGPLTINGSKEQPVVIRPLNPQKPFGVVAIYGKGAKRSRISYLDMEGGSIHQILNLKFTGMLSVHDCPDIEILDSRFGKNFKGDDAVHIMRSRAIVRNSVFVDSHLDAMDWDLVNGEIINSKFLGPGNDGVDLSMSNASIHGGQFERCRDKCISVGEGTRAQASFSSFRDCKTGVAVTDGSFMKLDSSVFHSCNVSWHSYRKKWRWENGGTGVLNKVQFVNSIEADLMGDKYSLVSFAGDIPDNLFVKGKIKMDNHSLMPVKK